MVNQEATPNIEGTKTKAEECRLSVDNMGKKQENEAALNDEDLKFLEELGQQIDREIGISSRENIKIQKVPNMLRQDSLLRYYEPRAIAIGPIHHSSTKTMLKEDLKRNLAGKFVKDSGEEGKDLLLKIKSNMKKLRARFAEDVVKPYDDKALTRMLFVDGCTVLEFINCYVQQELEQFKINNSMAVMVCQDFLLLENQIPYRVLALLMGNDVLLVRRVREFILMNGIAPLHINHPSFLEKYLDRNQPVHLLDLLRLATFHLDVNNATSGRNRGDREERPRPGNPDSFYRWSFRNIQDLLAAGIKLRPKKTLNLGDISFSNFFLSGRMKIPPLIVDESTSCKLFNLVAYEMCPDNHRTGLGVTSYLSFLDWLIDSEQDVKYLREANILRNRLSSDGEVAKLFNTLGNNLVPAGDAFVHVKNQIQKYCDRPTARWKAILYREHFGSPWKILALLAAGIALFLTAVSTWFTVYPKE